MSERDSVQDQTAPEASLLVLFRAGSECFALPLESVREVIDTASFHRLPGMPPHVTGVVSWGGHSLPIHDGARFLGVATTAERPSVLIMKGDVEDVGLAVDSLMVTMSIDPATIQSVPGLDDGSGALVGVFFHGSELVALLNPLAFMRLRESPAMRGTARDPGVAA
jgi:purine-binding chemotaxis protein CheW